MVSLGNYKKHTLVSFSKISNCTRPSDSCNFDRYNSLARACFFQIALETILLPTGPFLRTFP